MSERSVRWHRTAVRLAISCFLVMAWTRTAAAQPAIDTAFVYADAPVRSVLGDLNERTDYYFLYRDALVGGRRVSLSADAGGDAEEVLAALARALDPHGIRLQIDVERRQVLLLEADAPRERTARRVTGFVMDDDSGARLPYATVTWTEEGRLRGTAADESGRFRFEIETAEPVEITVSHIGFASRRLSIDPQEMPDLLPVRLVPETTTGPEVIVSTAALQSEVDTTWHHLLRAGIFAPLGESGVIRSLQTLPSVSVSTAASPGLNVRGSRADGFQVLLDGMSIYNQSHFFGLFDAFNEDVLQAVGLYYGVAPASLQGPPGGTLSFRTRTGSQRTLRASVGASSTSGKATLEGPLAGGRGSWLVSGRRSYLNAFDWFNNDELIGLGLDVGRETSVPAGPVREVPTLAVTEGEASALFYDAHGKLFYEWPRGTRLTLNGYVGGDETLHDAERLVNPPQRPGAAGATDAVVVEADTENDWHNAAASLQLQVPVGTAALLNSVAGASQYGSRFAKDDFVYTDPTRELIVPMDTARHVVRPFSNENRLHELKLAQEIDVAADDLTWSGGYALHRYAIDYEEASAIRGSFGGTQRSIQADAFLQVEGRPLSDLGVLMGMRTHYFDLGPFFRASPRFRLRLFPDRRLSLSAGFSRNHQFIHRLYVEQSTHADIWVMSTSEQPPGSVDHLTAGAYLRLTPTLFFQAETYRKAFTNLREHEASAARRDLRPGSPLLAPWLHDNEGRAQGLELMVRQDWGRVLWTNSYTLSSMDLRNDRVNEGDWYAADWDRRHQFTSHLQWNVASGLEANLAWVFATGAPNALYHAESREPERLPSYYRLDAGLQMSRRLSAGVLEIKATVFNLFDRDNTWYRQPMPVVHRAMGFRRVGLLNVDVYDLGLRPSVEVTFRF